MSKLKRVAFLCFLALLSLPALAGASAQAPPTSRNLIEVVVTLDAAPLARGGKIRTLSAVQDSVEERLSQHVEQLSIQHRYSTVIDGLAVTLPADQLSVLESTDGVRRVYPSVTYHSLRSSSPRFIGATALWGSELKTAAQGGEIGIIGDGRDRTH